MALCAVAWAEKVVTMIEEKDLPAAVKASYLRDRPAGATVRGFEREVIDGKTFYEVQLTVAGKGKEFLYRADGRTVEMEEETTLEAIPAGARAAIERAMGKEGKLRKVDVITAGKRVCYEGEILVGGEKKQVRFDAKGKPVCAD